MRALVTGATGFAGSHLMEALQQVPDMEAYGTSQQPSKDHHIRQVDLMKLDEVKALLDDLRPDYIFHLAAFASPALSFKQPSLAICSTVTMQINLYEACLALELHPRILVVSSGQIYGRVQLEDLPVPETAPLDFASPYAVGKVAQENLASMYAKRGLESVIARPFNHIGPRQQTGYLVADLSKQIAELEVSQESNVLRVGNLTSKRDFTDVRDIVRGYVELVLHGKAGEIYNVCSGQSRSGQEILDMLLKLSAVAIQLEPDPDLMRPSDIPDLYGDNSKIREDTGWSPHVPLGETLADTLAFWRSETKLSG